MLFLSWQSSGAWSDSPGHDGSAWLHRDTAHQAKNRGRKWVCCCYHQARGAAAGGADESKFSCFLPVDMVIVRLSIFDQFFHWRSNCVCVLLISLFFHWGRKYFILSVISFKGESDWVWIWSLVIAMKSQRYSQFLWLDPDAIHRELSWKDTAFYDFKKCNLSWKTYFYFYHLPFNWK